MQQTASRTGTLFVVATPLGHLDDLSFRARELLGRVEIIAAEDTRTSRKLIPDRNSPVQWISLHEHNEARTVNKLIRALTQGHDVALVSDAGTPLISDPGFRLVRAAREAGLQISPLPGPCAAIAALSVAGLPTDRFQFEGFLPARSAARRARMESLARSDATLVFYVPARDLVAVLTDASAAFGADRRAVVARELTKKFETVLAQPLGELLEAIADDTDQQRGESVLLVSGNDAAQPTSSLDPARLARELRRELPAARAARVLARTTGMARRDAFALVEAETVE